MKIIFIILFVLLAIPFIMSLIGRLDYDWAEDFWEWFQEKVDEGYLEKKIYEDLMAYFGTALILLILFFILC